ncbi:cupin domain-containing protein [Sphingomonas crusticola]|uniref:cupin domain-containing protein n=1 Tax=Sphingomonas crusticola TaxID=1697973 RepID=UPI0013C36CDB|nr:cupin domain-containing protein [Sphingomonas crusticola]
MRVIALGMAWALAAAAPAMAEFPADSMTFATSADVLALIAKAKAAMKPGQANLVQPLLRLAPYRALLEYRVAATPANAHIHDAELVYIVQGSGTVILGGTLVGANTIGNNIVGTGIAGGTVRRLIAGDVFLLLANTPHWFNQIDGVMVTLAMHLPPSSEVPRL